MLELTISKSKWATFFLALSFSIPTSFKGFAQSKANLPVQMLRQIKFSGEISSIVLNPNGFTLAVGLSDGQRSSGSLQLWNIKTGKLIRAFFNNASVSSIAFSPSGKMVATISGTHNLPKRIQIWDVSSGDLKYTLPSNRRWFFHSVAFSPDGNSLVGGSGDFEANDPAKVIVWDYRKKKITRILSGFRCASVVSSVTYSPNGMWLIAGGGAYDDEVGEIRLWNAKNGRLIYAIRTEEAEGNISSIAIAPNGVFAIGAGNNVTARNLHTGKLLWIKKDLAYASSVNFLKNGSLFSTVERDLKGISTFRVRETKTGSVKFTWKFNSGSLEFVASSRGDMLAIAGEDNIVSVWHLGTIL